MAEKRRTDRQDTIDHGVRAIARLADGTTLEGTVVDSSLGGARVVGRAAGLTQGDRLRLVFVFLSDERAEYECEVRHVDAEHNFFGVDFLSGPRPIDATTS